MWNHQKIFYDRIGTHLSVQSLIHDRCDVKMAQSAMEANRYISFTVQH